MTCPSLVTNIEGWGRTEEKLMVLCPVPGHPSCGPLAMNIQVNKWLPCLTWFVVSTILASASSLSYIVAHHTQAVFDTGREEGHWNFPFLNKVSSPKTIPFIIPFLMHLLR